MLQKTKRVLLISLILVFLFTASAPLQTTEPSWFNQLLGQWLLMAGVAGLVTFLVNFGKLIKLVKDDTAKTWSAALNLIGLVAFIALNIFKPDLDWGIIDEAIATFVGVANIVLTYLLQIFVSGKAHETARGIPVLGKSYSNTYSH